MMTLRKLLSCVSMGLFCMPAVSMAASGDPAELERLLAKIRREPMIFVVATGGPIACGQACNEWIAGEGEFDQGAAQRFEQFLTHLDRRDLPIFFNSHGGLVNQAVLIGLTLRQNRMTAGVARTIPEGCRLGPSLDDACRRTMQSDSKQKGRLYFGGARCASACVYALVGASTRHVDAGATLRIHSGVGPEIGKTEDLLRRYLIQMGIDPALIDAAAKISSRSFRGLSRGDMERFGIETRGVYETPWLVSEAEQKLLLLKSITSPTGDKADAFLTRTIGLTCAPVIPGVRFIFRRELTSKEYRFLPTIQAKIGDSLIDLNAALSLNRDSVEKYADMSPKKVQAGIQTRNFLITESFNPSVIKKPDEVITLSAVGLSEHIGSLQSRCAPNTNQDQ
jgi:hypothetical protein